MKISDVTLTFPDGDSRVTAVNNVTLEVAPGNVVVLTGPSGSGKSSLLAVAATLMRPDSGSVIIDGVDVTQLSRRDADRFRREHIGIVFQQSNLIPSLTAREQLIAVSAMTDGRKGRARVEARADELLEAVGLAAKSGLRPHQLSGGQRQRVNIARALIGSPSLLLVDEPTSALDQENGATITRLIGDLTAVSGASTLFVTHNLTQVPADAKIVTMVDGALVGEPVDAGAVSGAVSGAASGAGRTAA